MATDQKARGSNPLSFAKATDKSLSLFLLSRSSLHFVQQALPVNPCGLTLHCVSLFRRFAPYDPLSFAKATDKSLSLFLLSRSSLHFVQQALPVNPCGLTLHCVSLFRRFAPYDPLSFAKATDKSLSLFLLSRSSLYLVQQASPVNPCGKTTSKAEKALAFFRRA